MELLAHARSLEAQNEELKAMLRKHSLVDVAGGEWCVECGVHKNHVPAHSPDCALAKLIGE